MGDIYLVWVEGEHSEGGVGAFYSIESAREAAAKLALRKRKKVGIYKRIQVCDVDVNWTISLDIEPGEHQPAGRE